MSKTSEFVFPASGSVIYTRGFPNQTYTRMAKMVIEMGYSLHYDIDEFGNSYLKPRSTIVVLNHIRDLGETFFLTHSNKSDDEIVECYNKDFPKEALPQETRIFIFTQSILTEKVTFIIHDTIYGGPYVTTNLAKSGYKKTSEGYIIEPNVRYFEDEKIISFVSLKEVLNKIFP